MAHNTHIRTQHDFPFLILFSILSKNLPLYTYISLLFFFNAFAITIHRFVRLISAFIMMMMTMMTYLCLCLLYRDKKKVTDNDGNGSNDGNGVGCMPKG